MTVTLTKPRHRIITIGPADHGRRMSLDDFDTAVADDGCFFELNKGVVEVSGIPAPSHAMVVQSIRNQLTIYQEANPGVIHLIGGGGEAKMLIAGAESERHADLSVYLDPPPAGKDVWSSWVPAIAVEVVSDSSAGRDYDDKPAEYLAFGVDQYWIIDPAKKRMTALTRRRGQWQSKVCKPTQKYTTPRLPGFGLDLKRILIVK